MGIEDWTDVDYAQAAIDMLPGTVEEIDAWMKTHKIRNKESSVFIPRSRSCPVAQWVSKWTDEKVGVGFAYVNVSDGDVKLPDHVGDYVVYADKHIRP